MFEVEPVLEFKNVFVIEHDNTRRILLIPQFLLQTFVIGILIKPVFINTSQLLEPVIRKKERVPET